MKIILSLLIPFCLYSNFFEERLPFAKKGDFIVYEKGKNSSLLYFKHIDEKEIILEQITFPSYLTSSFSHPKKWLEQNAPGHTAYVAYTLDKKHLKLLEAYSYTEKQHLHIPQEEFILSKLLTLSLKKIPDNERRKTGDYTMKTNRKNWNPPITINGRRERLPCQAFFSIWPKDGSQIENKKIDLYFADKFFFPIWIETEAARVNVQFKASNMGNFSTTHKLPPKRRPYFTKKPEVIKNHVFTQAIVPDRYKEFELYFITEGSKLPVHKYKIIPNGEQIKFFIQELPQKKQTYHTLIISPKEDPEASCEISFFH